MYLLLITLYELGQFLRIVGWVFLPLFVIVLLVTAYLHHRRKRQIRASVPDGEEFLLSEGSGSPETVPERGEPDEDHLYKGFLWMKQKFEEYREQSDQRVSVLKEELAQAKEKIADLTSKLEHNMRLLMDIHKEMDRPVTVESSPAAMPEAASGGSGELIREEG
ncbi:MAG TPA: hypothetical protein VHC48_15260 [Puia sp.]|nr:hypothetical protein [Puia sp.]